MLKRNGLIFSYLAVNYRQDADPLYFSIAKPRQGCWRGFRTWPEAKDWIELRTCKCPDSPKGWFIYRSMSDVIQDWRTTKNESLKLALSNYLDYQERKLKSVNLSLS